MLPESGPVHSAEGLSMNSSEMVDTHERNAELLTEQEQAHWDKKSATYVQLMIIKGNNEPALQQVKRVVLRHLGNTACKYKDR